MNSTISNTVPQKLPFLPNESMFKGYYSNNTNGITTNSIKGNSPTRKVRSYKRRTAGTTKKKKTKKQRKRRKKKPKSKRRRNTKPKTKRKKKRQQKKRKKKDLFDI